MKRLITFTSMLLFCLNSFPQTNALLIEDFRQGEVIVSESFRKCSNTVRTGNCASIALIKASLSAFGTLENIFKKIEVKDSVMVTFNDGMLLSVSSSEIDIAKKLSGIVTKSDTSALYRSAIIIYALMAKRVLITERSSCISNFTNAIESLNSGYHTKDIYLLLGLKKTNIDLEKVAEQRSVVIWCNTHASYASLGKQDFFGHEVDLKGKKMRDGMGYDKMSGAYILLKN